LRGGLASERISAPRTGLGGQVPILVDASYCADVAGFARNLDARPTRRYVVAYSPVGYVLADSPVARLGFSISRHLQS
jgi:hypothetical protein